MRRGAPSRRSVSPASSPPGEASGELAVRAWVRILAVQKRAVAAIRDDLEREMTMPRFDLLANLCRADGQTLATLSRSMLVTAGNLTGLVDRAERDGLVKRTPHARDRRATRLKLTARGRALYADAMKRHERRIEAVFDVLSKREQHALSTLLGEVRARLRDQRKEMP